MLPGVPDPAEDLEAVLRDVDGAVADERLGHADHFAGIVSAFARCPGCRRRQRLARLDEKARVGDLMDRLALPLERFEGRSPYRLSGGEQRRLSLACVLTRRPEVLVLDEPTFGQDRHGYEGLLGILAEHLDDGACLIAATHDMRFVGDVGQRIVEMEAGWIVRDEPAVAAEVVA